MRTYDCEPVSSPKLPPMHNHPMWQVRKNKINSKFLFNWFNLVLTIEILVLIKLN